VTKGFLGRQCPRCKGTGREPGQMDGDRETCSACAGTGEEWGDVEDAQIRIEEPPK